MTNALVRYTISVGVIKVKPRDTIILPARVKIPIANEAKAQAKRDGITMNQWLNEAIKLRLSKGL